MLNQTAFAPRVATLSALGAMLAQDIPALARAAAEQVRLLTPIDAADARAILETLLDRFCISLTLVKPIGLSSWVERHIHTVGRIGVIAAGHASVTAVDLGAGDYRGDRRGLRAFLDLLGAEIERAALDEEPMTNGPRGIADATSALLAMLCEHDGGGGEHAHATAQWARRLALALGQSAESAEFIAGCALVHDIGKLVTLNELEDHAAAGARILSRIPSLRAYALIVRAHHERYDGAGYPDGLRGEAIPFASRVIAVADALDAMIGERSRRKPIAAREALCILERGRGAQWDPDVVDALTGMFRSRASVRSYGQQQISS